MDKKLLEKIVATFMFVETGSTRANGKTTHLVRRRDRQELSVATGKPIQSHRTWDADDDVEVIPGVDNANFYGYNTSFADMIWNAMAEYLNG